MELGNENISQFPKWYTDNLKVYQAGIEAIKNGKTEFKCPVCGKTAKVERSDYNGHLSCYCPFCNSSVVE